MRTCALQAVGDQVDRQHAARASQLRDTGGHLADRAEAEHEHCSACGHVGVLDRLPRRGEHVGQIDEAVVRRPLGDLDRPVLRLRHAQELRLTPRHLAVELGVAEQRGARVVVMNLRGLALRLQSLCAHVAMPAGDVEGDYDAVAGSDVGHVGANRFDHAHGLVAEHVAGFDVAPRTS